MTKRAFPAGWIVWLQVACVLASLEMSAPDLPAQRQLLGSIEGQIMMLNNAPIPSDLTVRLEAAEGTSVNQAFVGTDGKFRFDGIPNGLYRIVVSARGYRTATHSVDMSWFASRDARILLVPEVKKIMGASASATVTATDLSAPKLAQKEYEKGLQDLENGNFEGARKHLEKAIAQHPCYARAHTMLGVANSMRGQPEASEAAFNRAIECDPGFVEAYIQYAKTLIARNQNQACVRITQKGLQRFPNEWLLHYHLGIALDGVGDYAKAEAALLKARGIHPEVPSEFHLRIADVYLNSEQYDRAHAELTSYLRAEPRGVYADATRMILRRMEAEGLVASSRQKKDAKPKP
jgi:tetratricopeptide (TPR) repeat protein